jgi:hypothetical protein
LPSHLLHSYTTGIPRVGSLEQRDRFRAIPQSLPRADFTISSAHASDGIDNRFPASGHFAGVKPIDPAGHLLLSKTFAKRLLLHSRDGGCVPASISYTIQKS